MHKQHLHCRGISARPQLRNCTEVIWPSVCFLQRLNPKDGDTRADIERNIPSTPRRKRFRYRLGGLEMPWEATEEGILSKRVDQARAERMMSGNRPRVVTPARVGKGSVYRIADLYGHSDPSCLGTLVLQPIRGIRKIRGQYSAEQ